MKHTLWALVVALAFAIPSRAQQTTPQTTPITVDLVNSGLTSAPLNCYSVPMTIGSNSGTAWIATGFILFRPGLEGPGYVEAVVTSWTITQRDNIGRPRQEVIAFKVTNPSANGVAADPDGNGDSDTVQGSLTINFIKYSGYGRYVQAWVSGGGAQSIAQD